MERNATSGEGQRGLSDDAEVAAFKWARLEELGRLRGIGVRGAERISLCFEGKLSPDEAAAVAGKDGLPMEFARTARAVRQVIVLEMELVGLRAAPDREADRAALRAANAAEPEDGDGRESDGRESDGRESDGRESDGRDGDRRESDMLRDPGDYMNGPMEDVVARIRKDLRVEAPANDPFAPRPRQPAEPKDEPAAEATGAPEAKPEAAAPKAAAADAKAAAAADAKAEAKPAAKHASEAAPGKFGGAPGNRAARREQGRRARAARKANRTRKRWPGRHGGHGPEPPD